ncbi:hypothetical protein ACFY5F_36390 [Streptomyces sp. NPDC013161]|uniref:hypothetical protein n=1 Tax=Streptomyces sp. NPDC013161 TaxID=3364862 RepID=UPI0036D099D8
MITLHEVYEQGTEPVRQAVQAFGDRHPLTPADANAEPDWKTAEKHFTHLVEVIMGTAALRQPHPAGTIRRAENEAVQLLLTLNTVPNYRCPICVKQRRGPL